MIKIWHQLNYTWPSYFCKRFKSKFTPSKILKYTCFEYLTPTFTIVRCTISAVSHETHELFQRSVFWYTFFFSSNKSRKTTFKNISYFTIYVFVFPLDEIRGVRRDDRINIIICIHSVLRDNIIHAISAEQLFFPTVSFSFIIILLFDRRLSDTYHIKVSNCNVF